MPAVTVCLRPCRFETTNSRDHCRSCTTPATATTVDPRPGVCAERGATDINVRKNGERCPGHLRANMILWHHLSDAISNRPHNGRPAGLDCIGTRRRLRHPY